MADKRLSDEDPPKRKLTPDEFDAVTAAWTWRLGDAMGTAGCNDSFDSEFPASVCADFPFDFDVLEAWEEQQSALVSEVRASRELLAKLEWASECDAEYSCPSCWAPRDGNPHPKVQRLPLTHEPDCALARLLGR